MIDKKVLDIKWINQASLANNKADKILVEKVIRALLLLEGLSASGIPFVFKGGTALMLMFKSTKRLSIDIDIIIEKRQDPRKEFEKIVSNKGFIRFELQERIVNSGIKKAHFKFFYSPIYRTVAAEDYVLLDILFEDHKYQHLNALDIDSTFVLQDGNPPLQVQSPAFDDILGDKLTAFAPYTTGVPYEKMGVSKAMEIIKQLYDIAGSFDQATNPAIISQTFHAFAKTELGYRGIEAETIVVLDDIHETALHISSKGALGKGNLEALMRGISQLKQYIFSESFQIEKAITSASKAAYLSAIIKTGHSAIDRFTDAKEITDWVILNQQLNKLNKLKKSNPEAFFYWYRTLMLLDLIEDKSV